MSISAHKHICGEYYDSLHCMGYFETTKIFINKNDILTLFTFPDEQTGLLITIRDGKIITVDATETMVTPTENGEVVAYMETTITNIETIQLKQDYVIGCLNSYKSLLQLRQSLKDLQQIQLAKTDFDLAQEKYKVATKLDYRKTVENLRAYSLLHECVTLCPNNAFYHFELLFCCCESETPIIECIAKLLENTVHHGYFNFGTLLYRLEKFKDEPLVVNVFKQLLEQHPKKYDLCAQIEYNCCDMKEYCNKYKIVLTIPNYNN